MLPNGSHPNREGPTRAILLLFQADRDLGSRPVTVVDTDELDAPRNQQLPRFLVMVLEERTSLSLDLENHVGSGAVACFKDREIVGVQLQLQRAVEILDAIFVENNLLHLLGRLEDERVRLKGAQGDRGCLLHHAFGNGLGFDLYLTLGDRYTLNAERAVRVTEAFLNSLREFLTDLLLRRLLTDFDALVSGTVNIRNAGHIFFIHSDRRAVVVGDIPRLAGSGFGTNVLGDRLRNGLGLRTRGGFLAILRNRQPRKNIRQLLLVHTSNSLILGQTVDELNDLLMLFLQETDVPRREPSVVIDLPQSGKPDDEQDKKSCDSCAFHVHDFLLGSFGVVAEGGGGMRTSTPGDNLACF